MLQYIKKYIKGWLLGILLFFIFISFAFWGIGDIFRQNTSYIVKVGKMKVSRDEFLIEYQFRMNEFNKNKDGFKDVSKNERIRIANQALNNLTNRYLFLNMAENMDIKISKDVLKKQIFNNEMFYKKDGKQEFDKNIYNNIIPLIGELNNGISTEEMKLVKETKKIFSNDKEYKSVTSFLNQYGKLIKNSIKERKQHVDELSLTNYLGESLALGSLDINVDIADLMSTNNSSVVVAGRSLPDKKNPNAFDVP